LSYGLHQVRILRGQRDPRRQGLAVRARHASLKVADFEDFRTEDGYLYARIRAISSRVNKNHDGWPSVELAGGQDVFEASTAHRQGRGFTVEASEGATHGFSTFLGKPIFVDHNNSDPAVLAASSSTPSSTSRITRPRRSIPTTPRRTATPSTSPPPGSNFS
jgi:hypothetical protein